MAVISIKFKARRATDAQWTAANTVLDAGELGVITDLGALFIGDGATAYDSIPKISADISSADITFTGAIDLSGATLTLPDNFVTTARIVDLAVTTPKLADGAVTAAKLAANSATTAKIPDSAVTPVKLSGGKQTVWIPGGALVPDDSAPCETVDDVTGSFTSGVAAFSATVLQAGCFMLPMPKSWDKGTVTAKFYWKDNGTAGAGNVVWGAEITGFGDNDDLTAALGTAQEVTDGFLGANRGHITAETGAITVAGALANNDLLGIRVYRDPADGSDTYTQQVHLVGVMLHFSTNTGDDT